LDNFVEKVVTIIVLAGTDTDSYTRRVFATINRYCRPINIIGKLQLV